MLIPEPLYISAAHKSSGKTTITIGLCAALHQLSNKVQAFKKGPDYIDPLWHARATSNACYNLDYNTMSAKEILSIYTAKSVNAEISIIEGNKGLYDGLDLDGSNSNAALAKLLHANIILVLDAQGMTRGIAPLVLGYQAFDPKIKIAGVILNKLGGSRHESKLRAVLEHYTDVPVIGAVHRQKELEIIEKHLGLIPSNEDQHAKQKIQSICKIIKQSVNLEQLNQLSQQSFSLTIDETPATQPDSNFTASLTKLRIAIIKDEAFGFYYPADLETLEKSGAELVYCSALNDQKLPGNIDGIFIGGGFPERHIQKLSENKSFKQHLQQLIESGLPCYAECGGLMYLSRSISWKEQTAEMAGIIDADVMVTDKPQGRGLIQFTETELMPWPTVDHTSKAEQENKTIAAHEFHYSKLCNISKQTKFAYKIHRGMGIDGKHDAIVYKNLLASYAHLQDTEQNHWAKRFIKFIISIKNGTKGH
ncbi:MAG: hydrogenobyrinic acid a,c-diamide synthase (glutamine-hydrolyzing) [Pseudomonadota bacterium]